LTVIDRWVYQDATMPAFALSELDTLVRDGVVRPDSLIRHVSSEEWLTVSEVTAAAARLADSEMASQSAARVLRNMATQRLNAKLSENKASGHIAISSSIGDTIKSGFWAIPEATFNVIVYVAKWTLQYVNRKAILWTSLIVSIAALLWVSGVFKAAPKDLPDQVNVIWRNAVEFSSDHSGDAEWNTFAQDNLTRLSAISSELETAQQYRGIFGSPTSSDDNKWARWELIQVAKFEIPLALKAGPAKLPEFADAIESRFLRYDEFTARSSQSRVQNNTIFPLESGANGIIMSATADSDFATWLFIGIDVVLVVGVIWWWISRRSAGRSQETTSK